LVASCYIRCSKRGAMPRFIACSVTTNATLIVYVSKWLGFFVHGCINDQFVGFVDKSSPAVWHGFFIEWDKWNIWSIFILIKHIEFLLHDFSQCLERILIKCIADYEGQTVHFCATAAKQRKEFYVRKD
jgi:hypothetical protein